MIVVGVRFMMVETSLPIIPKETLFGNPVKVAPSISPDGTHLAFLAPVNGVLNIWSGLITDGDFKPITNDTDRGIRTCFWSYDGQYILYVQDVGGDENWRLFGINMNSGEHRDLTPFPDVHVALMKGSRDYPDTLLLNMNRDNPELHDVYRLTLSTGALEKVAANPGNVIGWVADHDLTVRIALTMKAEGSQSVMLIEGDDPSQWKQLLEWGPEDAGSSHISGFNRDGTVLYLIDSRGENTGRLYALDLATGQQTLVVADETYDVTGYLGHPETRTPQMVGILKDRLEWVVLDDTIREDIEVLTSMDQGDFSIDSRDDSDNFWIVEFDASNAPLQYYLYDRSLRKATLLFSARPDLRNYPLAVTEPFSFTSRDGLTVHGYITFPANEERENLPMVLNVHGGPWVRDTWGFHPEVQWLANRGYICMQVNYRGSTGYGKDFLNAAKKEWGGKMHDDLVDAVGWAVDKGYADPERVAIYGGSYGGFAALVGATFTPDLFKCAVDIVGPSNLISFINTIPPYWRPQLEWMYSYVGDPKTEEEFLKSRSPLFRVDNIKIPMLIAQGANDPRVKQSESEQIVAAMKEKGIPHQYLLFPDEGHGFAKPENKLKFYSAAESFLAEHLGGRVEE